MSVFLGRQDCIESLHKDLVDLQGATLDVFSRTGPVRFSSWKFPDKLSCTLDMVALLDRYDFVDGDNAFNQHSHIVLLELVIDRLLLLLQSFNAYVGQISHRREQSQERGCLSVGLVVRNYWSNLVQFANLKVSASNNLASSSICKSSLCPNVGSRNVSCQTVQSSLVPCDACRHVQSVLRKTGDSFIELLQSEGLPSSLQSLLVAVEDTLEIGHMTVGDVNQWAAEQYRDMRRLAKHLRDVRDTVQPLKDKLEATGTERDKFKSQLEGAHKKYMQDMEKHQANIVQLEFSLKKSERSMKDTEQKLQEEQQQLKREILQLEESISRLKETIAAQQATIQALEFEKNVLQEKVHIEKEACNALQQGIQNLEGEISETQLCFDKETVKYQSACRQQESMQAKQQSLLKRVDVLDEECEELQRQLGEREEEEIDLRNQLQQLSQEKREVKAQLTEQHGRCSDLQKQKQTLETHVGGLKGSVAELKELVKTLQDRERLLVAFPELFPHTQPQSTGNVLLDMEQQVRANSIRIKAMEDENATLHASLVKVRERAQGNANSAEQVEIYDEVSPHQTWSLSVPQEEIQPNHPTTPMHNARLQIRGATQLGNGNTKKYAGRMESAGESGGSDDSVSTTSASPSSPIVHFQTLQFTCPPAKNHKKAQNGPRRTQLRTLTQRNK